MFVAAADAPAAEHVEIVADAVEQGERIGCDEQGPPLAAELQDQLLHDENAFGVESAKRFVEQQDALQQMIENGLEDYEYRQSLEYIEKYAREELGMIDAGDTIWKQAD